MDKRPPFVEGTPFVPLASQLGFDRASSRSTWQQVGHCGVGYVICSA